MEYQSWPPPPPPWNFPVLEGSVGPIGVSPREVYDQSELAARISEQSELAAQIFDLLELAALILLLISTESPSENRAT